MLRIGYYKGFYRITVNAIELSCGGESLKICKPVNQSAPAPKNAFFPSGLIEPSVAHGSEHVVDLEGTPS